MAFHENFLQLKKELEKQGHLVKIPLPDNNYKNSNNFKLDSMLDFNENLKWSDAILIANYKKNNIENYIGFNSIMEIGMAFNQKKKIFMLFKNPINSSDELNAIGVIELNGDTSLIK